MLLSGESRNMPPPELTSAAVMSRRLHVTFPVASPGATMPEGGKTFTDVSICTRVGLC